MRAKINSVEFVKTWMASKSVNEVARKLDLTKEQASSKATNLRTKGVKLPRKRTADEDSVDFLNQIIERYSK